MSLSCPFPCYVRRYGGDFGTKAQLLDFVAAHLPPGKQGVGGGGLLDASPSSECAA